MTSCSIIYMEIFGLLKVLMEILTSCLALDQYAHHHLKDLMDVLGKLSQFGNITYEQLLSYVLDLMLGLLGFGTIYLLMMSIVVLL